MGLVFVGTGHGVGKAWRQQLEAFKVRKWGEGMLTYKVLSRFSESSHLTNISRSNLTDRPSGLSM